MSITESYYLASSADVAAAMAISLAIGVAVWEVIRSDLQRRKPPGRGPSDATKAQ